MTPIGRYALFAGFCAALALALFGPLQALIAHSRTYEFASHIVLVPFVSLALILVDRTTIFTRLRSAWPLAAPLLLGGLALLWPALVALGGASVDPALTRTTGGMVALVLGGFLGVFGPQAFRAALFPLLFLGFAIPVPSALVDGIVAFLQQGSADLTAGLFSLVGTPWHREGYVFSLPGLTIEVARECSGIRSSTALLLTGLVAGHLTLQHARSQALLALAIVPLAILKNGIRIVALSWLSINVDPGFMTGQLHHGGGFVFFGIALALLFLVLAVLRYFERPRRAL